MQRCGRKYRVLSVGQDAKSVKGEKYGVRTAMLGLAPHRTAGGENLCPHATEGCRAVCIHGQGLSRVFDSINAARLEKTRRMLADWPAFLADLERDLDKFVQDCATDGMAPMVRLNWVTDIRWELARWGRIPQRWPELGFYDYTKWPHNQRKVPENYTLTFSYSEHPRSWDRALEYIRAGRSVAVVFRSKADVQRVLREGWRGFAALDGDVHDVRAWNDAPIVALYAKGTGRKDETGFVVDLPACLPAQSILAEDRA